MHYEWVAINASAVIIVFIITHLALIAINSDWALTHTGVIVSVVVSAVVGTVIAQLAA